MQKSFDFSLICSLPWVFKQTHLPNSIRLVHQIRYSINTHLVVRIFCVASPDCYVFYCNSLSQQQLWFPAADEYTQVPKFTRGRDRRPSSLRSVRVHDPYGESGA